MHLLDANALIALGWPAHEHHGRMLDWFARHARAGWATTAFTQAAFVRVLAQPAVAGRHVAVDEIAELLLRNTSHPRHMLLALDFGFEQVLGWCSGGVVGHRQIADAWQLAAAARHGAKLLTFDHGVAQLLATATEREHHLALL
jgi:uncharacterized protein